MTHEYFHFPWRFILDVYQIYWNLVLDLDLDLVKSTLIQIDLNWYTHIRDLIDLYIQTKIGYLIHRRMRRPAQRVQVREVRRVLGVAVFAPEGRSGAERMLLEGIGGEGRSGAERMLLEGIGGEGMGVEIVRNVHGCTKHELG